jgi:hypothetical protein
VCPSGLKLSGRGVDILGVNLPSHSWRRHRSPLALTALFVVVGLAYSFLYVPIWHHHPVWVTPPDLWATYRSAQFVSWGAMGAVYSAGSGLVTLPGIAILMAPLALIGDGLGLTIGFPQPVAHPTAWLLVGPVVLASVFPVLSALNDLARDLGTRPRPRRLLLVAAAGLSFPGLAQLGHPEDFLALGLALHALRRAHLGQWQRSGWLLGASLCIQPLTVLVLPLVLGLAGLRRALPYVVRAVIMPVVLAGITVAADGHAALDQLLHQPNYPTAPANHPTPWLALAPRLSRVAVAAGPGRMIALAIAVGLAAWGVRSRGRLEMVLAGALLAFAARDAFEAVMVPYYLTPALVVGVLLASRRGRLRYLVALLASGVGAVGAFFHYGPWSYWGLMVASLACLWAASASSLWALPLARHRREDPVDEAPGVLRRVALG